MNTHDIAKIICSHGHSKYIQMCTKFNDSSTNIILVSGTNVIRRNKCCCQMKNAYNIVQIIHIHIHGRQVHMCVKWEVCNKIILGVIDTKIA